MLVAGGASPGWREDALLDETFVALTAHFFPSAHVFATVFFDFVWVIGDSDMCFEDVGGGGDEMILLRSSFIHRVLKAYILTFRCMKWPKSPPINVMGFNQII